MPTSRSIALVAVLALAAGSVATAPAAADPPKLPTEAKPVRPAPGPPGKARARGTRSTQPRVLGPRASPPRLPAAPTRPNRPITPRQPDTISLVNGDGLTINIPRRPVYVVPPYYGNSRWPYPYWYTTGSYTSSTNYLPPNYTWPGYQIGYWSPRRPTITHPVQGVDPNLFAAIGVTPAQLGYNPPPGAVAPRFLTQEPSNPPAPSDADVDPATEMPIQRSIAENVERGLYAILVADPAAAVEPLRAHTTDNPEDYDALRLLGLALLERGDAVDATAVIRLAYTRDPSLASRPIGEPLYPRAGRLRALVTRAVRHANSRNSASAWLTAAMLVQAESATNPGRLPVARKMIERAAAAGLDPTVTAAMQARLN